MRLRSNVLCALTMIVFCFGVSTGYFIKEPLRCQKYCPFLWQNSITLECCSWEEKAGDCPSPDVPTYDSSWNLEALHCYSDTECPMGYKCCEEANYAAPYNVCKIAVPPNQCHTESITETHLVEDYDEYDNLHEIVPSGDGQVEEVSSGNRGNDGEDGSGYDTDDEDGYDGVPKVTESYEPEATIAQPDGSGDDDDAENGSGAHSGDGPVINSGRESVKIVATTSDRARRDRNQFADYFYFVDQAERIEYDASYDKDQY